GRVVKPDAESPLRNAQNSVQRKPMGASAMMRYLLAALLLAAAPAWGQQVPNPVNAPASITSGHLYSATSNRQQAGDSGASVSSLTVTWPSSGQAVISHGDNSPTGVAAANYNCLVGNSTPAWVSGACGTTPQGRLSLTSAVAVMTGNVSAATTVYYVAYTGLAVPVWNGTNFVALAIRPAIWQWASIPAHRTSQAAASMTFSASAIPGRSPPAPARHGQLRARAAPARAPRRSTNPWGCGRTRYR